MGLRAWASTQTEIEKNDFDLLAVTYLNEERFTVAPKTTGRRLGAFRSYAKWAGMGVEYLSDYTAPDPGDPEPHPLPEGIPGVLRLVAACDRDIERGLIGLCGMAGCRISEARSIRSEHVNPSTMMLTIRGKGDKVRRVPIQKELWAILAPLMMASAATGEPLVDMPDRTARRTITRMGKRARLRREISSHDLRATFATAVYNKTKDIRLVQRLLGHASAATTERYIGVSHDAMRDGTDLFGEEDAA